MEMHKAKDVKTAQRVAPSPRGLTIPKYHFSWRNEASGVAENNKRCYCKPLILVAGDQVHINCDDRASHGQQKGSLCLAWTCSHLHPTSEKHLPFTCPSPALRAGLAPTSLLLDSQGVLLAGTLSAGSREPRISKTQAGHIPGNSARMRDSQTTFSVLSGWDQQVF